MISRSRWETRGDVLSVLLRWETNSAGILFPGTLPLVYSKTVFPKHPKLYNKTKTRDQNHWT